MEKEIGNKKSKFFSQENEEEEDEEEDVINELPHNNCTSGYVLKNNLSNNKNNEKTLKSYSPIDFSTVFPIKTYVNEVRF